MYDSTESNAHAHTLTHTHIVYYSLLYVVYTIIVVQFFFKLAIEIECDSLERNSPI